MTNQARTSRVLIALIVSMTIGAVVLMALDNGGPVGKVPILPNFSLYNYLKLNPIEPIVSDAAGNSVHTWNRVEVFYSNTTRGNLRELAQIQDLQTGQALLNGHFVIFNGRIAGEVSDTTKTIDGEIQRTERWHIQKPCLPDGQWRGTVDTVRICVVADGIGTMPTETQGTRTADLVEFLCKKYKISRKQVIWPANWPQF
ncbi:MAG: hypothetical protein J7M40_06260 [Planctomycetes bacterium]|nr:hypothetical protein [Planctomycetota bacterium]